MYSTILMAHSWLRWVVFLSLIYVLFRSIYGWLNKKHFTKHDNIASVILMASTHLQVLLGFWLYFFLSPITTIAPNSELLMKIPALRYWRIEHLVMMVIFLIIVQVGRSLSKKADTDLKKHKRLAISSIIGFIVLMLAMPWPYKPYGRPLMPEKTLLQKI